MGMDFSLAGYPKYSQAVQSQCQPLLQSPCLLKGADSAAGKGMKQWLVALQNIVQCSWALLFRAMSSVHVKYF